MARPATPASPLSLTACRPHVGPVAERDRRVARALATWVAEPESCSARLDTLALAAMADPPAALALAEAHLAQPDRTEPQDDTLALLHAMALSRTGATDQAAPRFDRVVFLARLHGRDGILSWALAERARVRLLRGDLDHATTDLEASIALCQAQGNQQLELIARANLGFVHGHEERPEPYAHHTRAALALARELDDTQAIAHCLCNLGGALNHLGQPQEAMACFDEALPLARARQWPYVEALALAGMGGVHYRGPRFDPAQGRALNAQAEACLLRIDRHDQVVRHLFVEAKHLLDAARPDLALPLLDRMLEGARTHGLSDLETQGHDRRADALEALGDPAGALGALRQAMALRTKAREKLLEAGQRAAAARTEAELRAVEAAHALQARQQTLEQERARLDGALEDLKALHAQLARTSRTDPLTGLANRRAGTERLHLCMKTAERHRRAFALVVLDIDHFKRVNDSYGHAAGDAALVELARRLKRRARETDVVARWGGEEFLLLLPDTTLRQAEVMVNAVLARIRREPFALPDGAQIPLTASAGVTCWRAGCDRDALFRQADRALYAAKAAGRDRAVLAPTLP